MPFPPDSNEKPRGWYWPVLFLLTLTIGAAISWFGYLWSLPVPNVEDRLSLVGEYTGARAVILYAIMVVGMLSRGIHDYIQNLTSISFSAAIKKVVRSTAFVTAVLVSPIVFFTLYNITRSVPDDIIAALLAFQNGFFWQTVLESAKGTTE